jgi:uncharacterized protein (UPF0303 family)
MVETTGGFTSAGLKLEAQTLVLPTLSQIDAIEISEIATQIARNRALAITIEVQLGKWPIFHLALPGTTPENDSWIARKARVVHATGNSTMHERVYAQENEFDWYLENNLPEDTHAIHGGGLPLNVIQLGLAGVLLISGLPQVQDHLIGVEVIAEFLARKGELQ